MKSKNEIFFVENTKAFKYKVLNWVNQFDTFCFLDNNHYQFETPSFDGLLAVGVKQSIELHAHSLFQDIKEFHTKHAEWLFGHFNYPSATKDLQDFPAGYFFVPQYIIKIKEQQVTIISSTLSPEVIFKEIENYSDEFTHLNSNNVEFKEEVSKEKYIETITQLQKHIQRGDCYEINFCHSFFANDATINPLYLYKQLTKISPNPFAALYKLKDKYCLCASPERFIKKTGTTIISQPIKGTSKRFIDDHQQDELSKNNLLKSEKDRSENVMIVDLVRNDFGKICMDGMVQVKELFGVYSFPQVHQMISTIQGEVSEDTHWSSIVEACFPMGSMTGAPKKRVMELIEQYEISPRGLFSGSIGYITPNGDFDFNVVIRSIIYNQIQKTISIKVGSGITIHSQPEEEYQECIMKVDAIRRLVIQ